MENNLQKDNTTLAVRDLNVAAYLLASGEVVLVKSDRRDKQVFFHFSTKEKAEELINKYWSDTDPLSPRNVSNSLRSLKDLIFSGS